MRPAVKVDDVVEVHQIVMFGPDRWIPARVVEVYNGGFSVKSMREPFDKDGHDLMALPEHGNSQNPAIWR